MRVYAGGSVDGDGRVDAVVLSRHAKDDRARVGNLRRDGEAKRDGDERGREDQRARASAGLRGDDGNLLSALYLSRTIVKGRHAGRGDNLGLTTALRCGNRCGNLRGAEDACG